MHAARLMLVVVFPQPPFCLMIAMVRICNLPWSHASRSVENAPVPWRFSRFAHSDAHREDRRAGIENLRIMGQGDFSAVSARVLKDAQDVGIIIRPQRIIRLAIDLKPA